MTRVFLASLLLAAVALYAVSAVSQGYPNRTIRVIVPASPGDSCDTLTRLVGQKVGERLGQRWQWTIVPAQVASSA